MSNLNSNQLSASDNITYTIVCNDAGLCISCSITTQIVVYSGKTQIATGNNVSSTTLGNMQQIIAKLKAA